MNHPPLNPDALDHLATVVFGCTLEEWNEHIEYEKRQLLAPYIRTISTYLAVAQPVVRGYIIVDKKTNAIDWAGELHTSIESAIESMTGPRQSMCRTAEEEDDAANDGRTAWWRIYSIHAVTDGPEVNDA